MSTTRTIRPSDIIDHMEVPEEPGLYVLGCFEKRVTLYSQQVRALNLIYALAETGRVKPDSRVAVIGAGVAGLTAAAGAAQRNCKVTLLEKKDQILTIGRGNHTRWLHPHIYDWPEEGADQSRAGLPLLDWEAGQAGDVIRRLERDWNELPFLDRIKIYLGVKERRTQIERDERKQWRVTWYTEQQNHDESFDVVILAVGFGLERKVAGIEYLSYWEDDNLHNPSHRTPVKRYLISGCGDGGLVDILRTRLRDFRHERVVHEFLNTEELNSIKQHLSIIDEQAGSAPNPSRYLLEEYKKLNLPETLDEQLKARLRSDTEVVFNSRAPLAWSLNSSILNRFLVWRLDAKAWIEYQPGEFTSQRIGDEYEVRFASGHTERFDRIICRHGPEPALEKDFKRIWEKSAPLRERNTLDQTRWPIWKEGFFDLSSSSSSPPPPSPPPPPSEPSGSPNSRSPKPPAGPAGPTGPAFGHEARIALERIIQGLQKFTAETLRHLEHFACLEIPEATSRKEIRIERRAVKALIDCVQQSSFLLIGEPGAGKSGVLYTAAIELKAQGYPVVAIAVDQHRVQQPQDLYKDLGINRPLCDILNEWENSKPGILFIDALDATRGGSSDKVFQDLIRDILKHVPNWRVVASIRSFDLRFGVIYRELFSCTSGASLAPDLCDSEFPSVRHLAIPALLDKELDQVCRESTVIRDAYNSASDPLRKLLHSPFNLSLLARILYENREVAAVAGISTQLDLLDRYWSYRIARNNGSRTKREGLLRRIAKVMIDDRDLRVSKQKVEESDDEENLERLLSDGVLSPAKARGDHITHISFSHHILFDYAVARLLLFGLDPHDLAKQLELPDVRLLSLAPAVMLAMQMYWQEDKDERAAFWAQAFNLVETEGIGYFCRMLPARVAAELTRRREDFAPVLACLQRADCEHRRAALFLTRYCIGALIAGILPEGRLIGSNAAPWCRILRELAEAAIVDVGGFLKPAIKQWTEHSAKLTAEQKAELGVAARLLLAHGVGTEYDEGAVTIGIQAIARTFDTAPAESAKAIRPLLEQDHVIEHGHKELHWLARESGHLLAHDPELLADLYRAAYCIPPLPSAEEQTTIMNSPTSSLISSRRQDFDSARDQLGPKFARLVEASPVHATEALIEIMNFYVSSKEHQVTKGQCFKFQFDGITANIQKDGSSFWRNTHESDSRWLLSEFASGLANVAAMNRDAELRKVVFVVASRNRLACVWNELLKAGVKHPQTLGRLLLPLLTNSVVLGVSEILSSLADLLAVLHPVLSTDERTVVEEAIWQTPSEGARAEFLCRLIPEALVLASMRQLRSQYASEVLPLLAGRRFLSRDGEGAERPGDDWWLESEGVDLSLPSNASVHQAITAASAVQPTANDDAAARREYMKEHWDTICKLHLGLREDGNIPEALRRSGWDTLAEVANKVALACEEPGQLDQFPGVQEMVLGAIQETNWPPPVADEEQEREFARSPGWGSPAPRCAGAEALMALARAKGMPDPELSSRIVTLVQDPVPAVRHLILRNVHMLRNADSALMWQLCEHAFAKEQNTSVLLFFLKSLIGIVALRPEQVTPYLLALDERVSGSGERIYEQLGDTLVWLLLHVWLVHDQGAAEERIRGWISNPIEHHDRVVDALTILRHDLILSNEQVRSRVIKAFEWMVTSTVPLFSILASDATQDTAKQERLRAACRILNTATRQIYYGSGAYHARRPNSHGSHRIRTTKTVRLRFLNEMEVTVKSLSTVAYPSVTHYLLETLEMFIPDDPVRVFRLVIRALTEGGALGGYPYESMGVKLVDRIIRRYLADFRWVLNQHEDCRSGLICALNVFVQAGWPEALQLAFTLPELLR